MNHPDAGRLLALISHDIGWDIDKMIRTLGRIPKEILALREQIAPLKTERQALASRYQSKGTQPSRYDNARKYLLSELKEEARVAYYRKPDYTTDSKGNEKRIELTDGRAEDIAHGHVRYRKFLEEAEEDHKRITELGKQLSDNYDKIEALDAHKTYLVQKIELAKALTYAWSAEARLAQ